MVGCLAVRWVVLKAALSADCKGVRGGGSDKNV